MRRPVLLSLGLLVLAPLVGEFLLGNTPISQLGALVLYVPLYGAGAVLVRECGRRLGGWPTIALFAAAYALVEEALVDQMVFNPGYLGQHAFPAGTEVPGLGISGTLVIYSLALHTVWSICVPVAIVESFDRTPTERWLNRRGLAMVAALFLTGCVFLGVVQAKQFDFVGTPAQFAVSVAAVGALVAAGVLVGRQAAPPPLESRAPRPWLLAMAGFVSTSAYWLVSGVPLLVLAAITLVGTVLGSRLMRRWSRMTGWDSRHRLALAAGAAATYALWFGPAQAVEAGTRPVEIVVGARVFGAALLAVLLLARRSLARRAAVAT